MYEKTLTSATNSNAAATAAIPQSVDRAAKSAHSGIDAATDAAHPTIDRLAAGAHKLVDNADEVADQAVQALGEAGVKGEQLIASGTGYVREHPLLTLGLAVVAGYVLSRLLTSR
jgi:alkylation response protein AidB-like acyl-CoA dehydrogenase